MRHVAALAQHRSGGDAKLLTSPSRALAPLFALLCCGGRNVGACPFSNDSTWSIHETASIDGSGGRGQLLQSPARSPLGLSKWGVGLTRRAKHHPKKPKVPRVSFALLSEVQSNQVELAVTRSHGLPLSVLNFLELFQEQLPLHAASMCHGLRRTERNVKEGLFSKSCDNGPAHCKRIC